jgi:hypothetical protein
MIPSELLSHITALADLVRARKVPRLWILLAPEEPISVLVTLGLNRSFANAVLLANLETVALTGCST